MGDLKYFCVLENPVWGLFVAFSCAGIISYVVILFGKCV